LNTSLRAIQAQSYIRANLRQRIKRSPVYERHLFVYQQLCAPCQRLNGIQNWPLTLTAVNIETPRGTASSLSPT